MAMLMTNMMTMMMTITMIVHCIEILLVQSPFGHCMQHQCNTGASFALIATTITIIIIVVITANITIISSIVSIIINVDRG